MEEILHNECHCSHNVCDITLVEISHSENIYPFQIGKPYQAGLTLPLPQIQQVLNYYQNITTPQPSHTQHCPVPKSIS